MSHCKNEKKDEYNDDKITKTTSSTASVKKLAKIFKKMFKYLTTVNTQLQILKEADLGLSDSEDEDEASHFQMVNTNFC